MKLTLREQMMLTAMKAHAGTTMPVIVIYELLGMSRQATVVCIRRLCQKLLYHNIVVERVSKLGRGHTGEYAIPLTIADA
jgi:hypothetical protein